MFYGPDTYYGEEVSVLEMDGQFDKLEELIYMESHLRWVLADFEGNTSTARKSYHCALHPACSACPSACNPCLTAALHLAPPPCSNTSAKFYGEITQQMLKNSSFPGSNNGTGLFQTIVGLKVRPWGCAV